MTKAEQHKNARLQDMHSTKHTQVVQVVCPGAPGSTPREGDRERRTYHGEHVTDVLKLDPGDWKEGNGTKWLLAIKWPLAPTYKQFSTATVVQQWHAIMIRNLPYHCHTTAVSLSCHCHLQHTSAMSAVLQYYGSRIV